MTIEVTSKQLLVFDFLKDFIEENGYSPSENEIQKHFGWKSRNVVGGKLQALEIKKYISRIPNKCRSITLTGREVVH